jgi:hypothetical protein
MLPVPMMPTFMYTSLRVPANGSAPVLEKSDDIVERALDGMGPVWVHPRQMHPILLVCLCGRVWPWSSRGLESAYPTPIGTSFLEAFHSCRLMKSGARRRINASCLA